MTNSINDSRVQAINELENMPKSYLSFEELKALYPKLKTMPIIDTTIVKKEVKPLEVGQAKVTQCYNATVTPVHAKDSIIPATTKRATTGELLHSAKATSNRTTTKDYLTYNGEVKRIESHLKAIKEDSECSLQEAYETLFDNASKETKEARIERLNAATEKAIADKDIASYIEVNGHAIVYKAIDMLNRLANILVDRKDRAETMQQGLMYVCEILTDWQPYEYHCKETQTIELDNGKKVTKKVKTGETIVFEAWYSMPAPLLYIGMGYRVYNKLKSWILANSKQSNKTISIEAITNSMSTESMITAIEKKIDKCSTIALLKHQVLSPAQYRVLETIIANGTSHGTASKTYNAIKTAIRGAQFDRDELLSAIKGIKANTAYVAGYAQDIAKETKDKQDKAILADMLYKLA